MAKTAYRFVTPHTRRISHPVHDGIEKYWFSIAAEKLPPNIGTAVNARDPVGLNRHIYRDVRQSLEEKNSAPGTFDLMNKGITILAESVKLINKDKGEYDVVIDDTLGGIVDGAHTAAIIQECNEDGTTPSTQFVEVYVKTGIHHSIIPDIAKGLNTGIQVAAHSIYNLGSTFDWLKELVEVEPFSELIAWKESDKADYDVRDLISVLELLNIIDFPNETSKHPIAAYEKWSIPLKKFSDDFEKHQADLSKSIYHRLRPILVEGLYLYDQIRHDFRVVHNDMGGKAGKLNIIEEASEKVGAFEFPFNDDVEEAQYRLTKGATYPILAAFRNLVTIDPKTKEAKWVSGFDDVLDFWEEAKNELVSETFTATQEIGRNPDVLGKNRKHWDNLHMKVRLRLLLAQLSESKKSGTKAKP